MRQLFPVQRLAVDPAELYGDALRRPVGDRPHVLVNMIASADGATAVGGRSGALGGPADRRVFAALRALADVVLVGAGTVRAEGYGPVRLGAGAAAGRRARGQAPAPAVAVVTGSVELDWSSRLFAAAADGAPRPLVVAPASADPARLARAREVAEVVEAGGARVDLAEALGALRRRGASVVLSEGGPALNAQLAEAGALDELCLTLAPSLVGGEAARIAGAARLPAPVGLELAHLAEDDGFLFLRYRVPPLA